MGSNKLNGNTNIVVQQSIKGMDEYIEIYSGERQHLTETQDVPNGENTSEHEENDPLKIARFAKNNEFDIVEFLEILREYKEKNTSFGVIDVANKYGIDSILLDEITKELSEIGVLLKYENPDQDGNRCGVIYSTEQLDKFIEIYEKMKTKDDKTEDIETTDNIELEQTIVIKPDAKPIDYFYPDDVNGNLIKPLKEFFKKQKIEVSEEQIKQFSKDGGIIIDGRAFVYEYDGADGEEYDDGPYTKYNIFEGEIVEEVEQDQTQQPPNPNPQPQATSAQSTGSIQQPPQPSGTGTDSTNKKDPIYNLNQNQPQNPQKKPPQNPNPNQPQNPQKKPPQNPQKKPPQNPNPNQPQKPNPNQPQKPNPNQPQNPNPNPYNDGPLTFEEILDKVKAARNSLSDGEMSRYECAKGGWLVPVQYDKGDWLRNLARFLVQGVLGSFVNIPRRIYSMIRTGRKQEEKVANITKNVNELPKDEFKVLVEGLESYKGHENLVSASLRNAVYARQRRETNELNMLRNRQISQALYIINTNYYKSNELESQLQAGNLSDAQQNRLWAEITKLDREAAENVRLVEALREQGSLEQGGSGLHGLEEESRAAREGSNLRGRKFARRYSQNEELEAQQAALKKQQRLAYQNGDDYGEVSAFIEHERLLSENTYSKKILGITVSRSDRNHRADGIFSKEYKPDDLARNLATIAAVTATTVNIMKQMRNQAIVQQRNAEATAANQHNVDMANRGEALRQDVISKQDIVENGIKGTEDLNQAAAFGVGHHNVGTKYNFTGKWGSTIEDQMFHQVMQGDVNFDTLRNFIKEGLPTIGKYAQTHSQYEYEPLLEAMKNLEQGGIAAIEQYNSAAKQLVQNAIQTGKLSAESVSMIELSPTYIETMLPLVLAGKAVTSKEYRDAEKEARKAEKKAERKAKREQNSFFEYIKFRRKDRDDNVFDVDQFEDDETEFTNDWDEEEQGGDR